MYPPPSVSSHILAALSHDVLVNALRGSSLVIYIPRCYSVGSAFMTRLLGYIYQPVSLLSICFFPSPVHTPSLSRSGPLKSIEGLVSGGAPVCRSLLSADSIFITMANSIYYPEQELSCYIEKCASLLCNTAVAPLGSSRIQA